MSISDFIGFLKLNSICYEENVDLRKKTWIHRGGLVGIYIIPANVKELEMICSYLYAANKTFLVVGHTSNLYIHNDYNYDIVVSTLKCNHFTITDNIIECECGAAVSKIANACIERGLQGMEFLTSLPGTIGGAICNNSTVKKSGVADLLLDLDFFDESGDLKVLKPTDLLFSFRNSAIKSHDTEDKIVFKKRRCG